MKPFKWSSPLEGLFWGLVDMSPLSSKGWSWLLTDMMKVARWLRPSCFIPGAESFHPEIVQHFPHGQLHSDLVPSMNPVPWQEYSQVRQHIDHCLNQEDTQVHEPASQKWRTCFRGSYHWVPLHRYRGHCTELRAKELALQHLETQGAGDPKSMIERSKETHSSMICPEKTNKQNTKQNHRLGTADYLMAVSLALSLRSYCCCILLPHSQLPIPSNL